MTAETPVYDVTIYDLPNHMLTELMTWMLNEWGIDNSALQIRARGSEMPR